MSVYCDSRVNLGYGYVGFFWSVHGLCLNCGQPRRFHIIPLRKCEIGSLIRYQQGNTLQCMSLSYHFMNFYRGESKKRIERFYEIS